MTISRRVFTLELMIHRPAKMMLTPCENIEEDDITIARRRLKIDQKMCKESRPPLQEQEMAETREYYILKQMQSNL